MMVKFVVILTLNGAATEPSPVDLAKGRAKKTNEFIAHKNSLLRRLAESQAAGTLSSLLLLILTPPS